MARIRWNLKVLSSEAWVDQSSGHDSYTYVMEVSTRDGYSFKLSSTSKKFEAVHEFLNHSNKSPGEVEIDVSHGEVNSDGYATGKVYIYSVKVPQWESTK